MTEPPTRMLFYAVRYLCSFALEFLSNIISYGSHKNHTSFSNLVGSAFNETGTHPWAKKSNAPISLWPLLLLIPHPYFISPWIYISTKVVSTLFLSFFLCLKSFFCAHVCKAFPSGRQVYK